MDEDAGAQRRGERPPVYGPPRTWHEPSATGERPGPATATVGWDLSFDCQVTFERVPGAVEVAVHLSDPGQDGVVVRMATREQVEAYALQLLRLARGEVDGVEPRRDDGSARWRAPSGDPCAGWERLTDQQLVELFGVLRQERYARDVVPPECWVAVVSAIGYERAAQVWSNLHRAVETAARWAIEGARGRTAHEGSARVE